MEVMHRPASATLKRIKHSDMSTDNGLDGDHARRSPRQSHISESSNPRVKDYKFFSADLHDYEWEPLRKAMEMIDSATYPTTFLATFLTCSMSATLQESVPYPDSGFSFLPFSRGLQ